MRASAFAIVALVSLVSCAGPEREDEDDQMDDGMGEPDERPLADDARAVKPPPVEPGLLLRVVGRDGDAPAIPVPWPDKEAAFIRLFGSVTSADIVDANFVFRVLDAEDQLLSSDREACRRFHVNQFGRIDAVLEGTDELGESCEHATGIADNLLPVIQLIPFADAPVDPEGTMHFIVEIAPEGRFDGDYVLRAAFDVIAPVPPECDDHP